MAAPGAPAPPHFDSLLGEYQRFRTGYPPALWDALLAAAPARQGLDVLDLATGTGLSAAGLQGAARRVVGLDLAKAMLRSNALERKALGQAEALPFRRASFDVVTIAQAFHWMDGPRALAEVRRVLRPRGLAAVWWKYEAAGDPTSDLADAVVRRVTGKHDPHTPLVRGGALPGLEGSAFEAEERWLDHAITYTWATYVGYQSSREVLRRLAGPLRPAVLEALAQALRERNGEAPFEVAYRTRLFLLRPRGPQ